MRSSYVVIMLVFLLFLLLLIGFGADVFFGVSAPVVPS